MKEQIYSLKPKIQNVLPSEKSSIFYEVGLKKDSHNNNNDDAEDSEFSYNEIKRQEETKDDIKPVENNFQIKALSDQENYILNILKKLFTREYCSDDFLKLTKKEQIDFLCNYVKSDENVYKNDFKILPDNMIHLIVATTFEGDCGRSPNEKPDWLDLEKFKRGQKFARDYHFGLAFSQLLSLFILFSFEDGLKPLIFTGKSSTPYTAFKRYISTATRLRNWYTEDPWTKDTAAYKDIQTVRKMHSAVRKRLKETDYETINASTKIKNPYCPSRDILIRDFQSTCPAPTFGQCPHFFSRFPEINAIKPKGLNQSEMAATQFGFMGMIILYPKYFGVHTATEEDFEAFCHTWRGIGYLLGVDDEFNFCRGSLNEIKQRSKEFLELWAIPNFRELTPECEHMMRCVIESINYYFPGSSYETSILYLSEMLNLHTPRLYSSLTYRNWLRYTLLKTFYHYTCQVPGVMTFMNRRLIVLFDKAVNFSAEKHEELKRRSEETLKKAINNF